VPVPLSAPGVRRDTTREATAPEVQAQRDENGRLNQALPKIVLENRLLKKCMAHPSHAIAISATG